MAAFRALVRTMRKADEAAGVVRGDLARRREAMGDDYESCILPPCLVPLYQVYQRSTVNMSGQREPASSIALLDEAGRRHRYLKDPEMREVVFGIFDALDLVTDEVREARREAAKGR